MATFSIGDAVGSGFHLIGRKPFSVFFWGLAYVVLGVAPVIAVFFFAAPDYFHIMGDVISRRVASGAGAGPDAMDMAPFMAMQQKMMLFQPVIWLSALLSRAVVAGAVFRAVLEPRKGAFAYLRLGAQELWLVVLFLAMFFLVMALIFVLAIPVGGITAAGAFGAKAGGASDFGMAAIICVGVLVYVCLFLWILLRFSLAAPMTFAAREFRLFESWSATKGHALKLFGMLILLLLIVMGFELIVGAVSVAVILPTLGMDFWRPEHLDAFFRQPVEVWVRDLAPWAVGVGLVVLFLIGALSAIVLAPWAVAFRQLTEVSAPPAPAWAPESALEPAPAPEPAPAATAVAELPVQDDHHGAPEPAAHADDHDPPHAEAHGPVEDAPHAEEAHDEAPHGDHGADDQPAGHDAHGEASHDEHPESDASHGDAGHDETPHGDHH